MNMMSAPKQEKGQIVSAGPTGQCPDQGNSPVSPRPRRPER